MIAIIEYIKYQPAHSEDKKEVFLLIQRKNPSNHEPYWVYSWLNTREETIISEDFPNTRLAAQWIFEKYNSQEYIKKIHIDFNKRLEDQNGCNQLDADCGD